MPLYEYQCACGVQFDGRASIADRRKPKPCPECQQDAPPVPPSTVSGHFSKTVDGPGPQNTGITGLDAHIDRVIGQSSKQGWDVAEGRKREKEEVMADTGATGHDLSKNLDGSYRVLKPEEKAAHKRSQAIHEKAGDWRRNQADGR
jgi:putative FmdB family regulatory protein